MRIAAVADGRERMPQNGRNENLLSSWKEISAYLGRDARTCIRWEKQYGLPVHRLEAESRGKVFAYRDEIDEWLRERAEGIPAAKRASGKRLSRILAVAAALFTLVSAAFFFRGTLRRFVFPQSRVPADFRLEGSTLVVVDKRGDEVWRWDSKLPNLQTEEHYRVHFQEKREGAEYVPVWPYAIIKDIDGDGRIETLFSIQTKEENREGALLCFNEDGTWRWRFDAGRALRFGGTDYRREYRIGGFDLCDLDGDGNREVIVISWHKPDWPCQVAVLDTVTGDLRGEYWNKGYIADYLSGDLDGDGLKETVLSGVNNEYNMACAAVFKGLRLGGVSPQSYESYRTADLSEGTQIAYILCPDSDVHQAMRRSSDAMNCLWPHEEGGFTGLVTECQIYYDFDKRFRCRGIMLSNRYKDQHRELAAAGKIHSDVEDPAYNRGIRDGVLYFENGRFVKHPVPPELARDPLLPRPAPPKKKRLLA